MDQGPCKGVDQEVFRINGVESADFLKRFDLDWGRGRVLVKYEQAALLPWFDPKIDLQGLMAACRRAVFPESFSDFAPDSAPGRRLSFEGGWPGRIEALEQSVELLFDGLKAAVEHFGVGGGTRSGRCGRRHGERRG